MVNPAVSVVIPTYNAPHFLIEAVKSVLAQSYGDYELIIIDDGSGPETREALEPCMDRIRYIYQENAGIAQARNRGIKESRGKYIAFLDHDDLWLPGKLEKQVARARECPDAGVVYCDFENFLDSKDDKRELGDPFRKRSKPEGNVLAALFEKNFINTLVLLIRRDCFDKVGGFDSRFRLIIEYDMALRLAGEYDFVRVPEVLARYRIHSGNTTGGRAFSITEERLLALRQIRATPGARRVPRGVYHREIASVHLKLAEQSYQLGRRKDTLVHLLKAVWNRPLTMIRLKRILRTFKRAEYDDLYREHSSSKPGS